MGAPGAEVNSANNKARVIKISQNKPKHFAQTPTFCHSSMALIIERTTKTDFYVSELKELLNGATIVNHNVLFDLNVLNRAISNYDLPFPSDVTYIDTLTIAKTLYPNINNHKLNTLCKINNIPLQHNNVLSDERALQPFCFPLQWLYIEVCSKNDCSTLQKFYE